MLGHNKLCEVEDFADETLARYATAIYGSRDDGFTPGREHRKGWEVAQTARALADFGAVHAEAELLGVGAGIEPTIFWATNHASRVFATDLYFSAGGWNDTSPRSMLENPAQHAPASFNERRLVVQHMNALELHYEGESFEGVFSSSSLEHFGDHDAVRQAAGEIFRVLKLGGIAALTTEYRLEGPSPGLPGTLLLDAGELEELIVEPFAWQLVEPLDLRLSEATLATTMSLEDAFAYRCPEAPHVVLRHQEHLFTSVHLALRKL